jgi:NADPH-dependent 2,4-dienoyl-CoA reductase/sulfur reductase-like enzyme
LTTGGSPTVPRCPGANLRGIFTLRTPEDTLAIRQWIDRDKPRNAVIVGAGYIGLEMAEALIANGLAVSLIEMRPQVLPNMDLEMATPVAEELARNGVRLHTKAPVTAFSGDECVRAVVAQGVELPADLVILSIGLRPAVQLAREAGIVLGETGAIAVSDHQLTNIENVWAAGDVSESMHQVTGKPVWIPLGTTANKQGRVAGENIAGGDASFPGVVGTAVVKVFGLEVARTGLTESEARNAGYDIKTTLVTAKSRAQYMPGRQPVRVKLVYEKSGHRLLGAQMVGAEGVAKRIDVFAAALQAGWTTNRVAELDLSYAPPFAPVWDPVLVAANVASK